MQVRPLLAVRADGGPGRGAGHLARSLALAQAWVDRHGDVVLVSRDVPEFWADQFRAEGCSIVDPAPAPSDARWWAVDGYHLGGSLAAPRGVAVVLVDDRDGAGTRGERADLVVDPTLGADPSMYPGARSVLAGPRYALLRRDVVDAAQAREIAEVARHLVIVLGGSPSPEVRSLGDAVAADDRLSGLEVRVLRGGDDVASSLATADLAFAAAGTVGWELCCHGVPAVLVSVADNQLAVADELARIGAAERAAAHPRAVVGALVALAGDAPRRRRMASIGRSLVDGLGARRVVCRLRSSLLVLRDATLADEERIFGWGNDPVTRAASFTPEPISWNDHQAWLRSRLAHPSAATYVAHDGDEVGLVRFDVVAPGRVEVGVTVAPARRGEGWGGALVEAGSRRRAVGVESLTVEALITASNKASIRAFEDADFDPVPSEEPAVLRYARHLDGDQ